MKEKQAATSLLLHFLHAISDPLEMLQKSTLRILGPHKPSPHPDPAS